VQKFSFSIFGLLPHLKFYPKIGMPHIIIYPKGKDNSSSNEGEGGLDAEKRRPLGSCFGFSIEQPERCASKE